MTLAEAHEIMRREVISLRHENERLKKGTYVSPEEKELKKLQSEVARLQKERDRYHRLWREKVENSSYYEERPIESPLAIAQMREYEAKIELLKKTNDEMQKAVFALQRENEQLKTGKTIVTKEREIKRLKAENERLTRARDQYHKLWRDVNLQNMIYQQDVEGLAGLVALAEEILPGSPAIVQVLIADALEHDSEPVHLLARVIVAAVQRL